MKYFLLALLFACNLHPKSTTPTDVVASTFRIDTIEGSGTAWIARNDDVSHLVTAGHVCEGDRFYILVDRWGNKEPAELEKASDKYDLCLVKATKVLGPALRLADRPPVYDEPVMAVGAPLGVYGCENGGSIEACGMAPISRGSYAGGNLVSMPMVGGNSGSAVLTSHGVIGVLVEGYRFFDWLSFIEPRGRLVDFLDTI